MIRIADIIGVLEDFAPLRLAEDYDNPGLQVGDASRSCSGVLLCVDPLPERVAEAVKLGCNLIICHHPLLFRGIKQVTGATLQQRMVIDAIKADVAVYAAHTNLDATVGGVNTFLAQELGLTAAEPLDRGADEGAGIGAVGNLPHSVSPVEFVDKVKLLLGSPIARCTSPEYVRQIRRVALCGGSGGSLIPLAEAAGADVYVTSDVRYHDFIDYGPRMLIVDVGHYDAENCTKRIFYHVISEKFPNFAVHISRQEKNPINYL